MKFRSSTWRYISWFAFAVVPFPLSGCNGAINNANVDAPPVRTQSAGRPAFPSTTIANGAAGNEKTLYSFRGVPDAAYPDAGVTVLDGALYGTTYGGGKTNQYCEEAGCGTVFRITPSGQETVIHRFDYADGAYPSAGLVALGALLYGTTYQTISEPGNVFAISPSGDERVLHQFAYSRDGESPLANLIVVDGKLYGTTSYGGYPPGSGEGTVYAIAPSGDEHVVYSFGNAPDGAFPVASLINVGGAFYGTTSGGGANECPHGPCGTVFKISPGGTETVLHNFAGGADGANPTAALIEVGGELYGTTLNGGGTSCDNGCGTVFKITTSGNESVVYRFTGDMDGEHPAAPLLNVGGALYGTNSHGGGRSGCGTSYECGTVFKVTTSGKETVIHRFAGNPSDGGDPVAGLIDVDGTLYGTTIRGGANDAGTVYSIRL